jgi:hypothetical protein
MKIENTKNYDRFDLLDFNRDVKKISVLEKSMRYHGWIDAYPMHVVPNGGTKLKIKAGHHRFTVARKLGIPVKYVICNDNISIHELEKATNVWKLDDYLISYIRAGKSDYTLIKDFHNNTGIGLRQCISLFNGEQAGSANNVNAFKDGIFEIKETKHAYLVASIVDVLISVGIKYAKQSGFVAGISKIAMADDFDPYRMIQKIKSHHRLIDKQATKDQYVELLDSIYNRQSREKVPLAFQANIKAQERSAVSQYKAS